MTDTVARALPITDRDVRCWRCRRVIAITATRPWLFKCHKCAAVNGSPPLDAHGGRALG